MSITRGILWLAGAFVAFGLLFSGCAATTAYNQEIAVYQALANQATEHFNKMPVSLSLTDTSKGLYKGQDHSIQLGVRNGYQRALPLLAHELGHHILGHATNFDTNAVQEMAANGMGVEVLQVWGYSFGQAFDMMGDMLCRARGSNTPGHASRAEEIRALKAQYAPRADGFHCWNEKSQTPGPVLAQADIDQYRQEVDRANREYLQYLERKAEREAEREEREREREEIRQDRSRGGITCYQIGRFTDCVAD